MRSTPTWRANTASNIAASTSRGSSVATGDEARAAMAMAAAAQAAMPAAKMHTRAGPRSRVVARSAMYSSWSRTVMVLGPPANNRGCDPGYHGSRIVAQDLGCHQLWGSSVCGERLICDDNPLVFYELSATLPPSPLNSQVRDCLSDQKNWFLRRHLCTRRPHRRRLNC